MIAIFAVNTAVIDSHAARKMRHDGEEWLMPDSDAGQWDVDVVYNERSFLAVRIEMPIMLS